MPLFQRVLVAAAVSVLFLCPPGPGAMAGSPVALEQAVPSGAPASAPYRLCPLRLEAAGAAVGADLPVRLGEEGQVLGAADVTRRDNGALCLKKGARPVELVFRQEIESQSYNALRVRMRSDAGRFCRLNWESDVEVAFAKNPGISVPVFADDEVHSYTLLLHWPAVQTWAGTVGKLKFVPADVPANVEIESMQFTYVPPASPTRLTVGERTYEALQGPVSPWELIVPPRATFEIAMALHPRSYQAYDTDGVRFTCVLETRDGEQMTLVDRTLRPETVGSDRGWAVAQADLTAFAGKRVRIRFVLDHLGSREGDLAFWGNPIVYERRAPEDATPVVLVSCDTLRAQNLSCYGYERETSPRLDAFAQEGVLFENVVVQDAWTLPSHVSMLTGLYPQNHRVTPGANLAEEVVTAAETLAQHGYVSAGFVSVKWWLEPWRGLSHGFDLYSTPIPYRNIFETHALVEKWMDAHPTAGVFLFVHNYDLHSRSKNLGYKLAYTPNHPRFLHFSKAFLTTPAFEREAIGPLPASDFLSAANRRRVEVTQDEIQYLVALYDDCIRQVDYGIHELLQALKKRGLYDNALIIVTSDHGEAFGEHGLFMHEDAYEHCARVPLIIRFPGGRFAGRRFAPVVQGVDIFPTIMDVLGLTPDAPMDGQSLLALLEGRAKPRERAYTRRHATNAVRTSEWKLLAHGGREGRRELYRVDRDPAETKDLLGERPAVLDGLEQELVRFYAPSPEGWHFLFEGGEENDKVKFVLSTDDRFESAVFDPHTWGNEARVSSDGRRLEGSVDVGPGKREELIIRTFSRTACVRAALVAERPFVAAVGGREPAETARFEALLNCGDEATSARPEALEREAPSLRIWHVSQTTESTAAEALTEEQLRELQALGYLQ